MTQTIWFETQNLEKPQFSNLRKKINCQMMKLKKIIIKKFKKKIEIKKMRIKFERKKKQEGG